MSKLSFVALSLQTTHLDPASVSNAAYVKLVEGNITRVDAVPVIPPTSPEAADQDSTDDPDSPTTWNQALSQLSMMIGKLPIVSYYRDADKEIFHAASRYVDTEPPIFHWLDCRELARNLLPDLPDTQLSTVLKSLNLYDEYADSSAVEQTTRIVMALAQRKGAASAEELWGELYDQPDDFLGLESTFEAFATLEKSNDNQPLAPVPPGASGLPLPGEASQHAAPHGDTGGEDAVQDAPENDHESPEPATDSMPADHAPAAETDEVDAVGLAHPAETAPETADESRTLKTDDNLEQEIPEFLKEPDQESATPDAAVDSNQSPSSSELHVDQAETQETTIFEEPAEQTSPPTAPEDTFSSAEAEELTDDENTTEAGQTTTHHLDFSQDQEPDASAPSQDEDTSEPTETEASVADTNSAPQPHEQEEPVSEETTLLPNTTSFEDPAVPVFLQDQPADDTAQATLEQTQQSESEPPFENTASAEPADSQDEPVELSATVAPDEELARSDRSEEPGGSVETATESVDTLEERPARPVPPEPSTPHDVQAIEGTSRTRRNTSTVRSLTVARVFSFIGVVVFGLISVIGLGLTVMAAMLFFTTNTLLLETKIAGLILTAAVTLLSLLMASVSYRSFRQK